MAFGLPPAPRWAWVSMIAGVVAIAVMLPFAVNRGAVEVAESAVDRTRPSEPSASPTVEASATPSAEPDEGPPVIAVYGDAYSAGSAEGGTGAAGWPALVAGRLDADVRLHAAPGAGYVAVGGPGTFLQQVQAAPEVDADVVVIFGSRNDTGVPSQQISDQAATTFDAVRSASPDAELVVIGPAWTDEAVPAEVFLVRDAVASAAGDAVATFVDPLQQEWFFGRLELIGDDAINPTDEGHAYLADLIEPILGQALAGAEQAE